MSNRPPEENKHAASELAGLIMSGSREKKQIDNLRQQLGLVDPGLKIRNYSPPSQKDEFLYESETIGIWKPKLINGEKYYTRDPAKMNEWNFWARIQTIPPKSSRFRIVFLGESVARGTFFDPEYTPAVVLETLLNLHGLNAEVIDLARTDIGSKQLSLVASASLPLQPDALVIFAGNNWLNDIVLSNDDIEEIFRLVNTASGFNIIREILEDKYVRLVSSFIEHIANLSESIDTPVIIIIPEYNILDWHCNETERILIFPQGESLEWHQLKEKAEQYIGNGKPDRAETLCKAMIELNGANPYSYELLARCKIRKKLYKEATKYLKLAHDSVIFQLYQNPGIVSIIQESLLKFARQHGIEVIDLPAIFSKQTGGKPPGRHLFMDYCHLSAVGIKIAMSHTAAHFLNITPDELKTVDLKPDNEVTGRAHFLAAIHNAHWGQSYEILNYHCLQAVRFSPGIHDLMSHYSVMASRHIPWIISKEFEEFTRTDVLSQYRLEQGEGQEIMDITLLEAIAAALKTVNIDIDEKIRKLRSEEHGVKNGRINLLESYYHLSFYSKINPQDGYFKALSFQSHFFFVTDKSFDIMLHITYRIPGENINDEELQIKVNDRTISKLPLCGKWKTSTMMVPEEILIDGINNIIIQWPFRDNHPGDNKKASESVLEYLMRRMRPVCGEIHTFYALKR